jgi:hypothetical protein
VAQRSQAPRRKPPRKKPKQRFPWIPSVVAGVTVAFITLQWTYVERIHPRTAEQFIRQYYAQVVERDTRDKAWHELTPGFQASRRVQSWEKYDAWWSNVKEVRIGPVQNVTGEPNRFLTKLTYVLHDGRVSKEEKTSFQLVCSSRIKIPLRNCNLKYIRIDYTNLPDLLARLF